MVLKSDKKRRPLMLGDCHYDQCKLLYQYSKILHFIKKHALPDATKSKDDACITLLQNMEKTLEKYVDQLCVMVCKHMS